GARCRLRPVGKPPAKDLLYNSLPHTLRWPRAEPSSRRIPSDPRNAPENLPKEGPGQVTAGKLTGGKREQPTRSNVRTLALRHSITRVSRIAPAHTPGRSRNLYPARYIALRCIARTLV